ncbi:glycerol-3-phosphate 1-O-acyltransferase PlsY [Neobacillus notoginsengisoli]|uniref:Glycerol-3-phosphate acyltransferase n=1 Tax=Neobacillus notoginsengisoli TaxID=1578198 RepID=A0A417YXN5_9BACI|nr:glycerol-3-phosphate 1-O-acyltransferase PlsY [Neobacillus notoginsengisoli]RHW42152.1 glycerol-3-phosphate 1-O-acyltransferase PlsY [Neobacillus notoginsengisoli]
MAETVLLCILAYLIGSIPSGLIVGKVFYKKDIRQYGSGNLGGTNTFRTLGVKAGIAVTLADILKGTLAASLPALLGVAEINALIPGMIAVIGHMYPVFAGFRGGKAVATSGGVLLFYVPIMFLVIFAMFFISLFLTKYVSLSSMVAGISAVTYSILVEPRDIPLIIIVIILTTFVFYRHRENIKRILNKTEPKIKWL